MARPSSSRFTASIRSWISSTAAWPVRNPSMKSAAGVAGEGAGAGGVRW